MGSNNDSRGYFAQETQQSELDKIKKENEYLKKKVALEEKKNEELKNENLFLSWRVQDDFTVCQKQLKKIDDLTHEKKWLLRRNKELHEQNKEKCGKTCVLRVIIWVCNYFLKVYPCERGLEKVLTYRYLAPEAQNMDPYSVPEDLECVQFMSILLKLGVVEERENFKYPAYDSSGNNYARLEMLNKAYGKIVEMDSSKRVVILGRVGLTAPNGEGHCVLIDLSTRMVDGTFQIYDPQKKSPEEQMRTGNLADFRKYLMHDAGLILYTINFKELQGITNHPAYFAGLYCTNGTSSPFENQHEIC